MSTSEKKKKQRNFIPAELHENKTWYINYYAFNHETQKLTEKRIKVNHIQSIVERRLYGIKRYFWGFD